MESITRDCFSLRTLEIFKSLWDSVFRPVGNEKVSMKEDEVVKTFKLKLSKGHGMAQN